jgi:rubrerythrin
MPSLAGTVTEQNLKNTFAWESQANRCYLYFAQKADAEGFNDVAAVFRSTAESKTGHAHRYLEYLEEVGDPATGKPIGSTGDNLKAAIAGETRQYTDIYPGMARVSGHGSRRPPGRLRRDRRLVRDARQGREVACRPSPKGARRTLISIVPNEQFEENRTTIGGKHGRRD